MALNAKGKKDIFLTGPLTCHRNFRTSPVKAKCKIYYIHMHICFYMHTNIPAYLCTLKFILHVTYKIL